MKASKELHGASTQGIGLKPISNGCWLRETVLLLQKVLALCCRPHLKQHPSPTASIPCWNRMIMAERKETSALENKVALFSAQYTAALLAYQQLLHRRWQWHWTPSFFYQMLLFFKKSKQNQTTKTNKQKDTFETYPLVFTKLLSLVRCVPQREPVENYIFFQNFQLVKCHQHLHWLKKSNRALYKAFWD